jgi:uncharacterized protein YdbL (DUF1318 family)
MDETLKNCLGIVLTGLAALLVKVITDFAMSAVAWTKARTNKTVGEHADQYLWFVARLAETVVTALNQTVVDALKKEGKFDEEAQEAAFDLAKERMLAILGDGGIEFLTMVGGDIDELVAAAIEAAIKSLKDRPKPPTL